MKIIFISFAILFSYNLFGQRVVMDSMYVELLPKIRGLERFDSRIVDYIHTELGRYEADQMKQTACLRFRSYRKYRKCMCK